jgi:hypothetical protein
LPELLKTKRQKVNKRYRLILNPEEEEGPVETVDQWPEQGTVSYLPAVRNRNGANATDVAAGRGYGMDTRHAYDAWNVSAQTGTQPTVVHVTNTNSSGAGSFANALSNAVDYTIIVFDVGGSIILTSNIDVTADGIWVAGQTAPELVWIQSNNNSKIKSTTGTELFFQHMGYWQNGDIAVTEDTFELFTSGSVFVNAVLDHCFFGGGTDETISIDNRTDATMIDCIVANPRGSVTNNRGYGSIIGNDNQSLVGCVYANCVQRSPLFQAWHGTICNHLVYNAGVHNCLWESDGTQNFFNFKGVCTVEGPDVDEWSFDISVGASFGAGSEAYIDDTRHVFLNGTERTIVDEWDVVRDVSGNNWESTMRVNNVISSAWPTGLVAAPNRSQTKEAYITLMTQNVGPRPSERITFIQDILDEITTRTGGIQDDYTPPTVASTTDTFVPVANPHAESSTDSGRTNLEVQLLDLAEALLV